MLGKTQNHNPEGRHNYGLYETCSPIRRLCRCRIQIAANSHTTRITTIALFKALNESGHN